MITPFDEAAAEMAKRRYHNHRLEEHSDIVSRGIYRDLLGGCPALRGDADAGMVRHWLNVKAPGARERKIDLFVGELASGTDKPDLTKLRICVENKSVMTAHRNRDARFDDLNETLKVVHGVKSDAVIVATILIGVADRTLNVPDKVKAVYKGRMQEFDQKVLPRLSSGDQTLWDEFSWAISKNRAKDPDLTVSKLRQLPTRHAARTHVEGYDFILFVPVFMDNVNPPYVARQNNLGINVDEDYQTMLNTICKAYSARWHL